MGHISIKNWKASLAVSYFRSDDSQAKSLGQENAFELRPHWYGKGAAKLGLVGEIDLTDLERVLGGYAPDDTCLHGKPINAEKHRAATEFTFSPPKPFSIAAYIDGDWARLFPVRRFAVETTLGVIESRYVRTRIWNPFLQQQERVKTDNLLIAILPHHTSRAGDPQGHDHALFANTTQINGEYRALDNGTLVRHKPFAQLIFTNELAYGVRQLGYEIEPGNGRFEIKGYSRKEVEKHSKRRHQIEAYVAQSTQPKSAKLYEQAALHTRTAKKAPIYEVPQQPIHPPSARNLEEEGKASAATAASDGIDYAESQSFEFRRELVEEFALNSSLGQQSWRQLQSAIDQSNRLLFDETLNLYTTEAAIARKKAVLRLIQQGQGAVEAIADVADVEALDIGYLSPARQQALMVVVTTTDRVVAWQGISQGDKTHAQTLYQQLAESNGYQIQEFDAAQLDNTAIHLMLNTVNPDGWIVQSAEKLSALAMEHLLEVAEVEQSRVLLIGDFNNRSILEAGSPFQSLQEAGIPTTCLNSSLKKSSLQRANHAKTQVWSEPSSVRGIPSGISAATCFGATDPENFRTASAINDLIRSTSSLTNNLGRLGQGDEFAKIDLDEVAESITDASGKGAIQQYEGDLQSAFDEINSNCDKLGKVLREFRKHFREYEKLHLKTERIAQAAAALAQNVERFLDLVGERSHQGELVAHDAEWGCTFKQGGRIVRVYADSEEKLRYNLDTGDYKTDSPLDQLQQAATMLSDRLAEETDKQCLLPLVAVAADLKLSSPSPSLPGLKTLNSLQHQLKQIETEQKAKSKEMRQLQHEILEREQAGFWDKLIHNPMVTDQKYGKSVQVTQEFMQLDKEHERVNRLLQNGESAYRQESQRQKSLYQTLSAQVRECLPASEQKTVDQGVAMLVLIASLPGELGLNLNALKNSPHLAPKPESEAANRKDNQEYLEQVQQTARQHLAWFQSQLETFKTKQRESQRRVLEQTEETADPQIKACSYSRRQSQIEM